MITNMDADHLDIKLPHLCDQVLSQLAKDTGYDLLPDLLSIFIADIEQRLSAIELSGRQSCQWWQFQLHPLKSTSATYGALKLNALTQSLESLCQQQLEQDFCQGEVFERLVADLLKELATVLTYYQDCLLQVKSDPSVIYGKRTSN